MKLNITRVDSHMYWMDISWSVSHSVRYHHIFDSIILSFVDCNIIIKSSLE